MEMETGKTSRKMWGGGMNLHAMSWLFFLRQLPNIFCEDNLVIRYLT